MENEYKAMDIAKYFINELHPEPLKLQKLLYFAQGFSYAFYDKALFNDDFEAWVHGPVSKTLYNEFKGFGWQELTITNPVVVKKRLDELFTKEQIEVLESVWDTYGEYGADQLEALTHTEKPWLEQRKGLGKFQSSTRKISKETMKRYYKSIAI